MRIFCLFWLLSGIFSLQFQNCKLVWITKSYQRQLSRASLMWMKIRMIKYNTVFFWRRFCSHPIKKTFLYLYIPICNICDFFGLSSMCTFNTNFFNYNKFVGHNINSLNMINDILNIKKINIYESVHYKIKFSSLEPGSEYISWNWPQNSWTKLN